LWSAIERHATKLALALVLVASVRIVATYDVFSHTNDEPAHIACGMEWLDKGVYRYEAQHPPLARIAGALGPYLLGRRIQESKSGEMFGEGLAILYQGAQYDRTLSAARLGILPFFWIAAFVVYAWARRDFGGSIAVTALFLFTFLPPVLAHAGLATTDMALTALLGAAFLSGRIWLERPSLANGAIFGACGALAVVSKFSSLAFFPAAVALALAAYVAAGRIPAGKLGRALKERVPSLVVALSLGALIVWATYRFSFGRVDFLGFSLPAPELFNGIRDVLRHNAKGHMSYLLGEVSATGFLGYYFVVLGVKTPIAFLLLLGVAAYYISKEWRTTPALLLPAAYAAAILLVGLFSRINIGVRHILPVYTGMSILCAVALRRLTDTAGTRRWAAPAIGALLGWFTIASALSHPDYLPYFNEFTAGHPEKIVVDSDLDWGQDMKRLLRRLHEGGARVVTLSCMYWVNPDAPGMPEIRDGRPDTPLAGWNAVGLTAWKARRFNQRPDLPLWPDVIPPQEVVGKSIYLWYFPASTGR
jgi:4-amino-4-deoxy-L-arabinose transferase-like glycosyltransferase